MKRIIHYLLFLIFLITAISCNTDGDIKDTSYVSYEFSMFYPQGTTSDYEFVFNGKKGTTGIVPSSDNTGLLQIFSKEDKDKTLFSQIVTVENGKIQFIKIGDTIKVYNSDEYISFTSAVLSTDYSLWFNGYECINNSVNYIPSNQSKGKFEIKSKDNSSIIWSSKEREIKNGAKYTFLPLNEKEFLEVPDDTEPNPSNNMECKVRLFYPNGEFDADSIRFDIYRVDINSWDWSSPLSITASVTLKKGELSQYVTFDYSHDETQYICYFYSITNANPDKSDEKYVDYMTGYEVTDPNSVIYDLTSVKYMKATLEIVNNGTSFTLIPSLSIKR